MDKRALLLEIKAYFQLIIEEKYLFKNPECLGLALDLINDLAKIDPIFSPSLIVEENLVDFTALPKDVLEKMLLRLKQYDGEMNKFRKVH